MCNAIVDDDIAIRLYKTNPRLNSLCASTIV